MPVSAGGTFRGTDPRREKQIPKIHQRNDSLPTDTQIALQKNIGFGSGIGILVGCIIGSGIFISPKGVLLGTGSVALASIVWIICGFMSLMGSLAYAELGVLIPNSGGQYFYMLNAFDPHRKKEKSVWKSLIPFVYFWQFTFFTKPAGMAVQGMAIAENLLHLSSLYGCRSNISNSETAVKLLAAVFISFITTINCYSNKWNTRVINIFTFLKIFTLLSIIMSGILLLSQGTNVGLKTGFEGSKFSFEGLSKAFYSGLWAFSGWDNLNFVTKELVNPKRDMLRSLIATSAVVTSAYFLTNLAYFAALSKEGFLESDAVAVDFAIRIAGKAGAVFMVIAVASSILGCTIGGNFTSARLCYAAAREGHMVDFLSFIHSKRMTPTVALALNTLLSLLLLPHSSVLGLVALAGFLDWIFIFVMMVSLLILRRTIPRNADDFKVPIVVPFIVMTFCLLLVVTPFIENPKYEYFFILLFLLVGVIVYIVFVYYENKLPGLDKIKVLVQKVLSVLPPDDTEI